MERECEIFLLLDPGKGAPRHVKIRICSLGIYDKSLCEEDKMRSSEVGWCLSSILHVVVISLLAIQYFTHASYWDIHHGISPLAPDVLPVDLALLRSHDLV